jgi:CubicO group peptidase (beta-lactamase class C family)
MKDTGYLLSREQIARCAPTALKSDGTRMLGETHDPLANYYKSTQRHCPGNAGLFSTARDLSIFCQMIVNEGIYGDRRVFKPETIRMMTSTQSLLPTYDPKTQGPGGNSRRGLGWIVYQDTPYNNPAAPDGSFIGHTGYTGTYAWIDKNSRSFIVYLANAVYSKDPPQINDSRREITAAFLEGLYPPNR